MHYLLQVFYIIYCSLYLLTINKQTSEWYALKIKPYIFNDALNNARHKILT